ncbi:hypothetical protein Q4602_22055 [Paraglaciecola chathamensis]|uniref:hypothetical protein n=1 Tax=Paraglaciecola chathamensis TaxID=368405 RepID=UPI0026FECA84|nr:hypothetical protein [Paraglaciecola chathamensis]MDO6842163.1 hypothetical protein [Paraglaciecola chathamensis]
MINWAFHIVRNGFEEYFDVKENSVVTLNETDYIDIVVRLSDEHMTLEDPTLMVGDVPIELEIISSTELVKTFKTIEHQSSHHKQIFYNYFGASEVALFFPNSQKEQAYTVKVDVRARRANAELAANMLDFLADNTEDALLLCFSKSYVGAGAKSHQENPLTKFELLKEVVVDLFKNQSVFLRDHKYVWENELKLSSRGQASGLDSINYLMTHLDKVSPASNDKSNIRIKNRSYWLSEVPCEELKANSDIFENRVIYSFLFAAKKYLQRLKRESEAQIHSELNSVSQTETEFVTFDNVLDKYKSEILKHHVNDIWGMNKQIDYLINIYKRAMSITLLPMLRPRMTPYVASRPHYRRAFNNINRWYQCNAPDLEQSAFLMGLRNLSTIYELTSLILLHKTCIESLGFNFIESQFRRYGENIKFQGIESDRPNDQFNNIFFYSNGNRTVSVKHEPRIYQYREDLVEKKDLINVSNRKASRFGKHFYLPDYVVTFEDTEWNEDLVVILDAKYQSYENLVKYSLANAEDKYLRNIFSIRDDMSIGQSPVKALILLYAHGVARIASRLHSRHIIGESLEVYPQALGLKLIPDPDSQKRITRYFELLIANHEKLLLVNNRNNMLVNFSQAGGW